ncbi:hypothetical protein CC78DRAFT_615215 [Lojkania enalia]|uniref:Uncharacterized protein n=1 Tax=Lojkania enalia TaxID=147567 RepID=A0A9P4KHA5_9PLEO|nr:hypothetical protein CC78DRAFT_615215 [Didymosphaeria enalia]
MPYTLVGDDIGCELDLPRGVSSCDSFSFVSSLLSSVDISSGSEYTSLTNTPLAEVSELVFDFLKTLAAKIDGVPSTKHFLRYKHKPESLNIRQESEVDITRLTFEGLLDGLISADQMDKLQVDPGSKSWSDPEIEDRFRTWL